MPAADFIAIHRRYNDEVINEGKLELIDQFFTADYVQHMPPFPEVRGNEGLRQSWVTNRTAFPDIHFTVEDRTVGQDRVVARWTASGTQRAEFAGIPATNKKVTFTGVSIHRFVGSQIQESWDYVDNLGLLQQLGAIPAPATT